MREYKIFEKYSLGLSVSKGSQKKFVKDGVFYKLNKCGNEGYWKIS